MRARTTVLVALVAVLAGCAPTPTTPTAHVEVGAGLEFRVEVAATPQAQRDGLSGRAALSEGTGMLFTFDDRAQREVWMAGMQVPIDVAWIVDGQVLSINTLDPCTLTEQEQCPRWTSPGDVDALLEVPAHALDGIEPGTSVTIREEPS
ncbi:DUF192 domain-containing protein [Microbacterium sp. NPDC055683]